MEMPDSPEWMHRPELDRTRPARLFTYAQMKQQWLKDRVHETQLPDAIDHLADELEQYVTGAFTSLPELTIVSQDVHYTREISGRGSRHSIESGPLPFEGDAALFGEHALRATLFGFHQGTDHDLRVYVSNDDEVRQFMGGIYTPLLSVGVEGSEIRLAEVSTAEQLDERGAYVREQLAEYGTVTSELVRELLKALNEPDLTAIRKLHNTSHVIAEIARHTETSQQFVDALIDIIFLKLGLNVPHDIQTSSHRVVITERPVTSYKAKQGPTHFTGVIPQLGLIGETANRGLGLFFLKDESAVQIPVQYITSMYRSQK